MALRKAKAATTRRQKAVAWAGVHTVQSSNWKPVAANKADTGPASPALGAAAAMVQVSREERSVVVPPARNATPFTPRADLIEGRVDAMTTTLADLLVLNPKKARECALLAVPCAQCRHGN